MSARTVIHLHGGAVGHDVNLGDTLMLLETIRRLRLAFGPDVLLSIRPDAGPYADRAALRLLQYLPRTTRRRPRGLLGYPMLQRYGGAFGVVTDRDVAASLNFMGYRYFDVGRRETALDLALVSGLRAQGSPTLMLPQACGPFSSDRLRSDAKRLFDACARVFARDEHSAEEVARLGCTRPDVVPDLTIASPVGENPRPDLAGGVALIPNLWMTQRVPPADAQAYVTSFIAAGRRVLAAGRRCFVLSHSPFQDHPLAFRIAAGIGEGVEIVHEPDAFRAKALVGGCRFVVGSRYHGLLAALSQGVPVLATSWSHKYQALLADYRCPGMLVYPSRPDECAARLEELLDDAGWERHAAPLPAANARARERIEAMWEQVLARVRQALPRQP